MFLDKLAVKVKNEETSDFVNSAYRLYDLTSQYFYKTPLIKSSLGQGNLFLKCENLQHTNSFKYRGAFSALFLYQHYEPKNWDCIQKNGLVTYSTGNFAKSLAYITGQYKIKLTVITHEWGDEKKIEDILSYNSHTEVIKISLEEWQNVVLRGKYKKAKGFFIQSAMNEYVTLGNATIGIEILEQFPDVESIIIPYGSGNLAYSLSIFFRYLKPSVNIYTVEVSSGAPFFTSFQSGKAITNIRYERTFVDGIGSSFVIPEQFYRIKPFIKEALVVTPQKIAQTVVQLALHDKLVVEGAGASTVAAGLHYGIDQSCCCILSGGNIASTVLLNLFEDYCHERG